MAKEKDKDLDVGLDQDIDHDLFNEENVPPSNWFKFDKVGVKVSGTLVSTDDKPERDGMPSQMVYTLKQKDGTFVNVGIAKHKDYVVMRANTARMGDVLGFEYKKDIPAKVKGHHPAKSIEVYVKKTAQGEAQPEM